MVETGNEHRLPGRVGYGQLEADSPLRQNVIVWQETLKGINGEFPPLRHPDFIKSFCAAVPDLEEQLKYVTNTSRYLDTAQGFDPNYVLLYRRTLPTTVPTPEAHWTADYFTAFRGLNTEIPGIHRLYSVILVSSLAQVEAATGGRDDNFNLAQSDGEVKFLNQPYDQQNCLFSFRPNNQETDLQSYLQKPDALTLEEVRAQVKPKTSQLWRCRAMNPGPQDISLPSTTDIVTSLGKSF